MINNLRLHTELLTPLSVLLLLIGGVLGYGSKAILKRICKNPDDKLIIIVKLVGLILAFAGAVMIFR